MLESDSGVLIAARGNERRADLGNNVPVRCENTSPGSTTTSFPPAIPTCASRSGYVERLLCAFALVRW